MNTGTVWQLTAVFQLDTMRVRTHAHTHTARGGGGGGGGGEASAVQDSTRGKGARAADGDFPPPPAAVDIEEDTALGRAAAAAEKEKEGEPQLLSPRGGGQRQKTSGAWVRYMYVRCAFGFVARYLGAVGGAATTLNATLLSTLLAVGSGGGRARRYCCAPRGRLFALKVPPPHPALVGS